MLLCREVLAWLRYRTSRDPACMAAGIAVEEQASSLQSLVDTNDGSRTIAIYKAAQGYTPRIEVRFTGYYPQVWVVSAGNALGDYISSPASPSFPGNTRAWDCSDFVEYLLLFAKSQFCSCPSSLLTLLASAEIDADTAKIPLEDIQRVMTAAQGRLKEGKKLAGPEVNNWLKKKSTGDLMDFAKSVIVYFKQGKLKWQDFSVLQAEQGHGQDIIPWTFFKTEIGNDANLLKKVPSPIQDVIVASSTAQHTLDRILVNYAEGDKLELNPLENVVALGQAVIAQMRAGKLPLHYLPLMEECDPKEKLLPWSLIRRSVIAYKEGEVSLQPLPVIVMRWLHKSNLVSPLYGTTKEKFHVLTAVKKHVDGQANDTIKNTAWIKELFKSLATVKSELDMKRELQVEFDLWLHQALAPSNKEIPLSPHAFTAEMKQEALYQQMYDAWLAEVKATAAKRQEISVRSMAISLQQFYDIIADLWKKDNLGRYKAKAPSMSQIAEIAASGNKDQLLTLLLSDVEHEIGSPVPEDIRHKMMSSPYFHVIYDEIIFQSVKIP